MQLEISVTEAIELFKSIHERPEKVFELVRVDVQEEVGRLLVAVDGRERNGEFHTVVLPRSQRYDTAIAEDFTLMYLTGISTRSLALLSKRLLGRRTSVIEIVPSEQSAERIIGALLVDQDEKWQVGRTYLNMDELKEWESKQSNEQAEESEFAEAS